MSSESGKGEADDAQPALRIEVVAPRPPAILRLPKSGQQLVPRIRPFRTPLLFGGDDETATHLGYISRIRPNGHIAWVPRRLPSGFKVRDVIVAGKTDTWFILTDDGNLFSTGSNNHGLLGSPHLGSAPTPHYDELSPILAGERVIQVIAVETYAIARTAGSIAVESRGKVATLGPARKYGWGSTQGKGTVARIPRETTTLGPDRWYGWGSNPPTATALIFPDLGVHPPTHIRKLDGVVDIWCEKTRCFAMMQRPGAAQPVLCGWGSVGYGVIAPDVGGFDAYEEPIPIPGLHEWADAEGLRVLRVSTSLFAVCLLGSEDRTRSVVAKWGSMGTAFVLPENRTTLPHIIYDSATAVRNPDGSPCVAVDAYTLGRFVFLVTSQRHLLVYSFGSREDHERRWLPVKPIREQWLEAVLLGDGADQAMMLVGLDGELYTHTEQPSRSGGLLTTAPDGQSERHALATIDTAERRPHWWPDLYPARLPTLFNPRIQMEAFVGAWLVARRSWLPHNNLVNMPRDIARLLADYIRTSSPPAPPSPPQ